MTEDEIFLLTVIDTALDLASVARITTIAKIKPPSTKESSVRIALALAAARRRLTTDVSSQRSIR
ncbi:MAG: hypothetical protein EOO38_22455 [Cytophagaceae bacterium]|nr:MAG: hypothetical protein EOO38_22455 [Cytophagaceae bacterium]